MTHSPTANHSNIYTIAANNPFADVLANYCDDLAKQKNIPLSAIKIYLPTRRGCRTLQDAFLQLSNGKPRLLPIMQSIGDADLEEANFSNPDGGIDILPAIDPMRRQMALARLLKKAWPHDYNYHQALSIASDLGQLIDQIHTENIDIQTLPDILEKQELAEYWQVTSQFLMMILNDLWPKILKEAGMIDPGLHRRLRIETLTDFYRTHPPKTPVIMAGSTGSIPVTRNFIKTIASLDEGIVILPALDQGMDGHSWLNIEDGHPQYLLKKLLETCHIKPHEVKRLGGGSFAPVSAISTASALPSSMASPAHSDRLFLASEMMRPAQTTEKWQSFRDPLDRRKIIDGSKGITYCEGESDHHEAMIIALSMVEIAADPDQKKTATLITPDRYLAMRVQANLRQWGIDIDDSGGTSLTNTPLGQFALSILQAYTNDQIYPIPFLACLKNPYAGGGAHYQGGKFRNDVRSMEKSVFRGVRPHGDCLEIAKKNPHQADFLSHLDSLFSPLKPYQNGQHSVQSLMTAHLKTMENIAATATLSGAERLWIGDIGETTATFFATLQSHADITPVMSLYDYMQFIEGFLSRQSHSARYGKHPRLSILGQIEARMVQADRVILSGLNEGIWPPDSGFDTWMSRKMRRDFGLPSLEQKTTLAAHDFATAFCAADVFVTRSKKSGGQPTLPSRWMNRLQTVLQAANIPHHDWPHARGHIYTDWAEKLSRVGDGIIAPIDRPAPKPSLDRRPTEFSVTDIEKWMRDPYWIYAKKILKLRKLDDVDMDVSAADRGTLIHDTMDEFTKAYPDQNLPENALDILLDIGRKNFDTQTQNPEIHGFWWPRFTNAATWFIGHETKWRDDTMKIHSEIKGTLPLIVQETDYILTGKADRIEQRADGSMAIIDYKTGASPSVGDVLGGVASQLPLEAYILQNSGFSNSIATDTSLATCHLHYWILNGSGEGGKDILAQGKSYKGDIQDLVTEAAYGLQSLLDAFHNPHTPYLANPDPDRSIKGDYNDYAHLERIAEWSVSGNNDDESEAA